MQIIRPNADIVEGNTLKVGDTFEFNVDTIRYGICIVTSIEESGRRRWFSLHNYSTGVSSTDVEVRKLTCTLTIEEK